MAALNNAVLRRHSFKWHTSLAWVAALAMLAFTLSGLTHPLLSWTGPSATSFRPPSAEMHANQLSLIPKVLAKHSIKKAVMVKLLPSKKGVVLQVTESAHVPRRYFDLETLNELPKFDRQQAQWLAQYYVFGKNKEAAPISHIEFQTEFDNAYPWVNRLLPVYKVTFADQANTSAFIYTEINVLAGLGNDYKTRLQSIFSSLHNWSWLEGVENARIILIACLLLCILGITLTGIGMILLIKKRNNMTRKARTHRLIACIVWLPLLGFSSSGFWHLLHYGFSDVHRGLKLGAPIEVSEINTNASLDSFPNIPLNQVSLIEHQGALYYRLSIPNKRTKNNDTQTTTNAGEHAHHTNNDRHQRDARFNGQATEHGGLYYSTKTGLKATLNDRNVAIEIASKQLGLDKAMVTSTELIKHFGLHYDFRNKRLPVWQIEFDSALGDKAFVDPATGMLVDRLVNLDRYEGYSFSFLHKWNFLTPFIGRFWRDVLVVIVLLLIMSLTLIGIFMTIARRRQKK